ncbi:MAG TPA: 6-phosphogluconolactonase [Pyrinomonadaceae bacterium]|nr:6-phosphogluconolactonase [Pyrinomonadaceae bacterium]
MSTQAIQKLEPRAQSGNVWLSGGNGALPTGDFPVYKFEVLPTEAEVGRAMLDELESYASTKNGDLVVVLLGGRGAQAMYRIIRERAETDELDALLARLHVFTQDALAPMRMDNSLSFVRDFERLLGTKFFSKIKSFTSIRTETDDIEHEMCVYVETIRDLGGIDVFFLGLGPEAEAASHICYIKPGSGARAGDWAGIIPISPTILEHHISKFKVGGSTVSADDEAECRSAGHILTLGPAAVLGAKKIVQSIVDASTAPGKIPSFRRFVETELSPDPGVLARQCDENPGLWIRLHPNVSAFVLPDLLS